MIRLYLNKNWICYFLVFVNHCSAQDTKNNADALLKKATEVYLKQDYINLDTDYNLFKDYTSTQVYEHYDGLILKNKSGSYFKVKNTEFVVFNKYTLKVNHDQRAVVIQEGTDKVSQNPLSLVDYLKGFKSKLVKTTTEFYVCELIPSSKVSLVNMAKVILTIKKADLSLVKQVVYYAQNMQTKNSQGKLTMSLPRLEISFTKRTKTNLRDELLTQQSHYFNLVNKKIIVSPRLTSYKLFKP